jgi:hypothetical protein
LRHIRRNWLPDSSRCWLRRWSHRARIDNRSEPSTLKRLWNSSACSRLSCGRSRGSWIDNADAMTSTSRTHPSRSASSTIRPSRGSTGSRARSRPILVRRRGPAFRPSGAGFTAASSSSSAYPSTIERWSGGSTKGNRATSPSPTAVIWRMTDARFVRRISGSVNSGRVSKSSSANNRMQMPGATRPHRPARWFAEA